jgi:hypothetical protein
MAIHIEVEANASCPMSANMVYANVTPPRRIERLRIYDGDPGGSVFAVTGWSSAGDGSAVPAYFARVEDSGAGAAFVVYGGDWGLRLRPMDSTAKWDVADPEQWGESHLLLADEEDLLLDGAPP